MTLKTPQDQQAVNARPTPQWDFAPEGALASSPQVGLGGAGGRALLSSILNTYVQKTRQVGLRGGIKETARAVPVGYHSLSAEGVSVRWLGQPNGVISDKQIYLVC